MALSETGDAPNDSFEITTPKYQCYVFALGVKWYWCFYNVRVTHWAYGLAKQTERPVIVDR